MKMFLLTVAFLFLAACSTATETGFAAETTLEADRDIVVDAAVEVDTNLFLTNFEPADPDVCHFTTVYVPEASELNWVSSNCVHGDYIEIEVVNVETGNRVHHGGLLYYGSEDLGSRWFSGWLVRKDINEAWNIVNMNTGELVATFEYRLPPE